MADTGKQSPLGQNVLGGILQNRCIRINPNAQFFMGISRSNSQYTFGTLVTNTVLRMLVWAINDGYVRGLVPSSTYNNLISINGYGRCYALGNSKPPTYIAEDSSESWAYHPTNPQTCKAVEYGESQGVVGSLPGPANAGYSVTGNTDYGQQATWLPYDMSNPNNSITQWGWIRCHALQAHNEFNWHAKEGLEGAVLDSTPSPRYEDFLGSFNEAYSYIQYNNKTISTAQNAETFLEGSFSNMNDLITGDVTGVTLYTKGLADDLQRLQKLFDFRRLDRFGFPSTLLQQLYENGGLTKDLNLALGSAGLSENEIRLLSTKNDHGTAQQERKIYTAFLSIAGRNLQVCLSSLTDNSYLLEWQLDPGYNDQWTIRTLADCLNPWYLFLNTRWSLTVPLYNTQTGLTTGSKTYYLLYPEAEFGGFDPASGVNPALDSEAVRNVVGTLFTAGQPQPTDNQVNDSPNNTLPKGYDSYLGQPNEILPKAIALAAGALRYTFLQISNIEQITPGKLGDCIQNLELMDDSVALAFGTEASEDSLQKPVDNSLVDEIQKQMGLGSNVGGNYRMDDFFGNMSGNPYPWRELYNFLAGDKEIENVTASAQTSDLAAIYQQLFLAVSWEPAQITLQLEYTCTNSSGTSGTRPAIENESNEDYQPDPALPDYNPYLYELVDPSTGLPYEPKQYTNNQWQPSLWAAGYRIKPSQSEYNPLTNDGGGYGRGGAPDPAVVINYTTFNSDGSTIEVGTIGRDDSQTGSNGGGTFGRVQSAEVDDGDPTYFATGIPGANWEGSGIPMPTDPPVGFENPGGIFPEYQDSNPGYGAPVANVDVIAEIEYPPIGTYSWRPATGGTNSPYQSSYNYGSVPQYYISAANSDIYQIAQSSQDEVRQLNVIWNIMGKQMKVEQRTRYNSIGRVEIPRDPFTYSNQDLVSFVDSMPDYSDFKKGLQARTTLELIVDRGCNVGQNIAAQLRQEKNEKALSNCGIPINNNIPDTISPTTLQTLVTNGTVPGAQEGIVIGDTEWVNPGWPEISVPGGPTVEPPGVVDNGFVLTPTAGSQPGDLTPLFTDTQYPVIGSIISVGPPETIVRNAVPGTEDEPGGTDFTGGTTEPGTNAGGGTPAGPNNPFVPVQSVQSAVDQVIHCNCDCWDLLG